MQRGGAANLAGYLEFTIVSQCHSLDEQLEQAVS